MKQYYLQSKKKFLLIVLFIFPLVLSGAEENGIIPYWRFDLFSGSESIWTDHRINSLLTGIDLSSSIGQALAVHLNLAYCTYLERLININPGISFILKGAHAQKDWVNYYLLDMVRGNAYINYMHTLDLDLNVFISVPSISQLDLEVKKYQILTGYKYAQFYNHALAVDSFECWLYGAMDITDFLNQQYASESIRQNPYSLSAKFSLVAGIYWREFFIEGELNQEYAILTLKLDFSDISFYM